MFTTAPLADLYTKAAHNAQDVDSAATALKEEASFAVLYRAIERCVDEGLFQTEPGYGTFEMALTAWSHVHGSAMLRVTNFRHIPTDFSAIDRAGLDVLYRGFSSKEAMTL